MHYVGVDASRCTMDEAHELYAHAKFVRSLRVSEIQEALMPFFSGKQ